MEASAAAKDTVSLLAVPEVGTASTVAVSEAAATAAPAMELAVTEVVA